ncbi:hypothetical protein BDV93DRAFT_505685 [Ceratobasidium sp. AG-I]|nr:hypothetical protein BDV93DRAFT_505685 [Ceratobasidium sp. AG-I]
MATSPTQESETEPRITDTIRRMVELAREAAKDPSAKAKESQRKARIAMLMAMSALDTPDGKVDGVELLIMRRLAEEKERRRAEAVKEETRAAREREARREDERNSGQMVLRQKAERECADCQDTRTEREEGSVSGSQLVEGVLRLALEEMRKAKEMAALAQEDASRARQEAARERERANRAEDQRFQQAVKDKATRQLLHEQQELIAWSRYNSQWKLLKRISAISETGCLFRFEDFPWPTVVLPATPSMITTEEVSAFLFSGPALEEGQTIKSRIKDCLLTWHPDKFSGKWMRYVLDSDRARVCEGIEAVTRAGRKVLEEYTSGARRG